MATHKKVEPIKMIYAPADEPKAPERTPEMTDEEYVQAMAEYSVEHATWEKEQKEAEAMSKASDPTDGPGPANGPVVNADNPVWENPKYFGTNGPGVN